MGTRQLWACHLTCKTRANPPPPLAYWITASGLIFTVFFLCSGLVGSLKKDQSVLAKNVEGLKQAIDDAVIKVKVNLL